MENNNNALGGISAVRVSNENGGGRFLIVCDHASNYVPEEYRGLGLSADALASHIAWDPGALRIAQNLSVMMDAPLIAGEISRLVYDVNRPPDSPDAMRETSEHHEIPGNLGLDRAERDRRTEKIYRPFHAAIENVIEGRLDRGLDCALVTVHTFTPIYLGVRRSVEIGILHDRDARLADAILENAAGHKDYRVARNEPYGPADGVTHTLAKHGIARGLLNVMIEIRNDLVATEPAQKEMAKLLWTLLLEAAETLTVSRVESHVARA